MDLKSHWIRAAQSSGVWSASVSRERMEQGLGLLSMKSLVGCYWPQGSTACILMEFCFEIVSFAGIQLPINACNTAF